MPDKRFDAQALLEVRGRTAVIMGGRCPRTGRRTDTDPVYERKLAFQADGLSDWTAVGRMGDDVLVGFSR